MIVLLAAVLSTPSLVRERGLRRKLIESPDKSFTIKLLKQTDSFCGEQKMKKKLH